MPAPALAVAGALEEAVDQPLVGSAAVVGEEGVDLLGGRRQAVQVEGGAADQGPAIGLRGGREAGVVEPIER